MLPTREEALKLICDGLLFNPGPWGKHCLTAAHCAEKIASACGDMDVEKAYILLKARFIRFLITFTSSILRKEGYTCRSTKKYQNMIRKI